MLIPDVLAQAALFSGLSLLKESPAKSAEFLATYIDLYPAVYAQAMTFFGNTDVPVLLGYPFEAPPAAPIFVVVNLGPSAESDHYIGSALGEETTYVGGDLDSDFDDNQVQTTDVLGVMVRETVYVSIYGQNQNEVVWVSNACRWALLRKRRQLEDAGLVSQSIAMQDLRLSADDFKDDYVFKRVLTLSGTSNAEVTQVYTHHITGNRVQVIDNRDTLHPYLVNDPEE